MLTSRSGLRTLNIGVTTKRMSDVEQVHAFLHDNSQNRPAAEQALNRLQSRLRRLKTKGTIFGNIELSEHVQTIIKDT